MSETTLDPKRWTNRTVRRAKGSYTDCESKLVQFDLQDVQVLCEGNWAIINGYKRTRKLVAESHVIYLPGDQLRIKIWEYPAVALSFWPMYNEIVRQVATRELASGCDVSMLADAISANFYEYSDHTAEEMMASFEAEAECRRMAETLRSAGNFVFTPTEAGLC